MPDVTCPECDERIQLKNREPRVSCPACGTMIPVPEDLRRDPDAKKPARAKKKAEKDEDADEPKRKPRKRRFGDDPDDEVPSEGSRTPQLIFGAVVALVVIGLIVFALVTGFRLLNRQFGGGAANNPGNANPGNPNAGNSNSVDTGSNLPRPKPPFEVDPQLEKGTGSVYLSDMTEFDVISGPWPFTKDNLGNPAREPLKVEGAVVQKGLSMHPGDRHTTRAAYALGGKGTVFRGVVALNDSNPDAPDPVVFSVYGDGKELWRSKPIKRATGSEAFSVNVRGVKVLEVRATSTGSHWGAHAVWIWPVIDR